MTDLKPTAKPAEKRPRAHLCMADNCRVITIEPFCWKHRRPKPAGEWAVAAQIKAENGEKR